MNGWSWFSVGGAVFSWGIVLFQLLLIRRSNKRRDRLFSDMERQQENCFEMLSHSIEAKVAAEEELARADALRRYLLDELEKRGIPVPDGFGDRTYLD